MPSGYCIKWRIWGSFYSSSSHSLNIKTWWQVSSMHLPENNLCTMKTELALEVKFHLDFHRVYVAMATNVDQRQWRQIHISAVPQSPISTLLLKRVSEWGGSGFGGEWLVLPVWLDSACVSGINCYGYRVLFLDDHTDITDRARFYYSLLTNVSSAKVSWMSCSVANALELVTMEITGPAEWVVELGGRRGGSRTSNYSEAWGSGGMLGMLQGKSWKSGKKHLVE